MDIAEEELEELPITPDGPEPALQPFQRVSRSRVNTEGLSQVRVNGNKTVRSRRQNLKSANSKRQEQDMKPNVVVDEMFPEGAGPYMDIDEAGGSSGLLMDLAANEKSVHTDFFNQFDDLYDDEDLS